MTTFRFLSPSCLLSIAAVPFLASGGEHVLVMGDSLTKEYRSEFVALYPDRPASWDSRNWIEILDERRHDSFDLGSWEVFTDLRLTGHEFNWAKPGGTVREFRNFLRQTADAEAEIKASSGGEAIWPLFPSWRSRLVNTLNQSQRVILFYGANDLALGNSDPTSNPVVDGSPRQIDYESIYRGNLGEASNPDLLRASIRANTRSVIEFFRNPRTDSGGNALPPRWTGPMILCAVPHVGCTPKVQQDAGTDPERTAVLTGMIETLNAELRNFAATKDVGFADIYPITKRILDPGVFEIGGVTFYKEADPDARPRYLFSGDGFHPNTAAHAKIAQVVAGAFLEKYPEMEGQLQRISDREIITAVLGLSADTGYREWMAATGLPGENSGPLSDPDVDGVPNAMEYALGNRLPQVPDQAPPFTALREPDPFGGAGEVLTVTWLPRYAENAYLDLVPQYGSQLAGWQTVPAQYIETLPDGRLQTRFSLGAQQGLFFRLAAVTAS